MQGSGCGGFSFNFFGDTNTDSQQDTSSGGANQHDEQRAPTPAAQELQGGHVATPPSCAPAAPVSITAAVTLLKHKVTSQQAAEALGTPELQASDLVPQQYEGGFKLWEGAVDLCAYLVESHGLSQAGLLGASPASSGLKGKRILELGAGHGLPGILCQLAGATVHFQDFNPQVLTTLTIPNVTANLALLPSGAMRAPARFFAGDWQDVGPLLARAGLGGSYDMVITAETIYSTESQQKLLDCIKLVLRPPHGIALVAAKSFYFGVGGSTTGFAELVAADGVLTCSQVWVVDDGAGNKREVLQLSLPASVVPFFL